MAANNQQVRFNYVAKLQNVCSLALQLNRAMTDLNNLYLGAGLSGTFVDAELAAVQSMEQLVGVDIGTITTDVGTVQASMTAGILQVFAKCVGTTPGGIGL